MFGGREILAGGQGQMQRRSISRVDQKGSATQPSNKWSRCAVLLEGAALFQKERLAENQPVEASLQSDMHDPTTLLGARQPTAHQRPTNITHTTLKPQHQDAPQICDCPQGIASGRCVRPAGNVLPQDVTSARPGHDSARAALHNMATGSFLASPTLSNPLQPLDSGQQTAKFT